MFERSCSADKSTVNNWKEKWLKHLKANSEKFDFVNNSAMLDYGKYSYRPVICAGSGPSLKKNIKVLSKDKPDQIGLVSCLHNFAFFVDHGIKCDGFVNLDAGEITIPEVSQGGKQSEQYYWDATKDYTLLATTVSLPELVNRWQGRILWFDCPVPDGSYMDERQKICGNFQLFYNVGGNALGAVYYHARAVLGGMPIVFIGADFSFDYTHKFHSWDSPYDQQFSGVVPCTDVFGNRVYSWQSYVNFANWFMAQSMGGNGNNPSIFINCTEGGIMGSFPHGNIRSIQQMALADLFAMYNHHKIMPSLIHDSFEPSRAKLLF
jgi:hypothetical protein